VSTAHRPRPTGKTAAGDPALAKAWRSVPHAAAMRAGWDPLAAVFHFGTKDAAILRGAEAEAVEADLERRAAMDPPPPALKKPVGRGTPLPARRSADDFTRVLFDRRTWRGFGRRAMTLRQLGTLLHSTFGYQMSGRTQGGQVLFKTSPSGGACHPIEAYVLALRVQGLAPALYHYSPQTRCLHVVRRGAGPELTTTYLPGQPWYAEAGALVLMTAVLPRVWWRYPGPRSYRAILLDAGHVCQTFCLVATWLGLAPFCTMALGDSRIERDLGVDGIGEVLLYAAGVGSKPADGRWVQWPGNRPIPTAPRARAKR
jgi:SagB-type dehydrogenase family enzyme